MSTETEVKPIPPIGQAREMVATLDEQLAKAVKKAETESREALNKKRAELRAEYKARIDRWQKVIDLHNAVTEAMNGK